MLILRLFSLQFLNDIKTVIRDKVWNLEVYIFKKVFYRLQIISRISSFLEIT